ncbi:MAG: hypothetical protein IJS78_06820 [Clostridia bacterium]|nr:hypothetical protein [Clostridia bacterium]
MIMNTPPLIVGMARTHGDGVTKDKILATARAMADRGLVNAGYEYLNIGDGWAKKSRDPDTKSLVPDIEKLGGDLKGIADELAKSGIKLGVVTSAGTKTPNGFPGSFGYEYEDARFLAESGVRLISHDLGSLPTRVDPVTMIRRMGMASRTASSDMIYSVFSDGDVFRRMIRSTGAHLYHNRLFSSAAGVVPPPPETFGFSVPGSLFNCGETVLSSTTDEAELKRALVISSMASSPITVDADITMLTDGEISLLTDRDIIAVTKDRECRPARLMSPFPEAVYLKVLDENRYAAAFVNCGDDAARLSLFAHDMGLTKDARRFVVAEEEAGGERRFEFSDDLTVTLDPGESSLFFLRLEKMKGGAAK